MIRTKLVELSTLDAVAYRQRLGTGHSGVVILRYDSPQPGLARLNRNTGEPDPAANVPRDRFPIEAFREALELTSGLPYSRRGRVRLSQLEPAAVKDTAAAAAATPAVAEDPDDEGRSEDVATVCSDDYAAIVKAYTNRKGELSYELLNKALIQAAHGNAFVADLVARRAPLEQIRDHVVKANFEAVTGNRALTMDAVQRIVEMLDAVSPRSVLRELDDALKRMLAAG
ncbi:MAG: hypothetical protein EA413_02260 [Cyanobium sp. PLM2.Bin73]|nr:MAG: hypothetical protein EA413_02260 [Cyanobium sp. PLM2.Bin73]